VSRLREFFAEPEVVAVGETGLDYFKEYAPRALQQKAFRAQLALALVLKKPVVIHLRDAADDLLKILGEHRGVRGVVHSFTGDWALAQELLALGFYLSVIGIVTFEQSSNLRAVINRNGQPLSCPGAAARQAQRAALCALCRSNRRADQKTLNRRDCPGDDAEHTGALWILTELGCGIIIALCWRMNPPAQQVQAC
jgi:hypothetical protein